MGRYEGNYANIMYDAWVAMQGEEEFPVQKLHRKLDDKESETDRIKCEYCGKVNPADINYCVRCGDYIGNLEIIPGDLYRRAIWCENMRQIDFHTMGLLEPYERKQKPIQPAPVQPVTTKPDGITIPIKAVPTTKSTDRAENIRVINEQNKLYESDQYYMRFLDNLLWMIPVFFGSFLLNGSWMIRLGLIIYFIYGICKMCAAEERWK